MITAAPWTAAGRASSRGLALLPAATALTCLGLVVLDAAADLLPDDPLVWLVTPVRLVIAVGLLAVLVDLRSPVRLRTGLDVAVALLVGAAALATVSAGSDWSGWRGVLTWAAAFFLAVGVRRTALGTPPALGLLAVLAVAIAAVTGVRQGLAGAATGFCRGSLSGAVDSCDAGGLVRVVGTFSNPNLLAAFLVLLLPLAAAGALALTDRATRGIGVGIVGLGVVALLWTVSRGALLGALAAAGAYLVLRRPTARRLVASTIPPVAVAGVLVLAAGGAVGVRADVWAAAAGLVAEHPLGVGPGRAGSLLAAAIPGDEQFQHAHNLWLNWMIETGVPGLLAVLALTTGAAVLCVRAVRAGEGPLARALGSGLAGFAVVSLADHPANAARLSAVLWIVLGLVAASAPSRLLGQESSRRSEPVRLSEVRRFRGSTE